FQESRVLYYKANIQKIRGEALCAYQTCQTALQRFPTIDIVPEFRKLLNSCWQAMDPATRPPASIPGYPNGYYCPLDDEKYFNSWRDEEDLFKPWERFKDIRGMQESAAKNNFGSQQNF